jgi:Xaa-Pro dipeptidase
LLSENKIEALILDLRHFASIFLLVSVGGPAKGRWLQFIPAKGDVTYVCPGFEESRLRELIKIGKNVYAWQEDESPYKQIAIALKDAGIQSGYVGIEERLRFFYPGWCTQRSFTSELCKAEIRSPCLAA